MLGSPLDAPRRTDDDQGYTYDRNGAGGYSSSYEAEKANAPPKSTGYLHDWRKSDRGKVLTRVSPQPASSPDLPDNGSPA